MDKEEAQQPANRSTLLRLGRSLLNEAEKKGCWNLLRGWLGRLVGIAIWSYGFGLLALMLALRLVGERNPATAFFLYLPPAIWVLPAVPLTALALLFRWRSLPVVALTLVIFAYQGLDWRWSQNAPKREEKMLTLLTYNRGQHMNQSLQPFKRLVQPDLLLLQDAPGRAASYARAEGYEEFIAQRSVGEFTLLSRYPIVEQTLLPPVAGQQSRAARFVVDWEGAPIAVYSVHLMTPRDVLQYQVRGAFLYGLVGVPGTPWAEKRRRSQSFWDGQIAEARALLEAVRSDPLPAIIAGDFNAPHLGYIHRLLTREWGDAHATAGGGFGFTFPGSTHNPLSRGGPWLRIDHIFFTRDWQAQHCVTEADRPSQHRALAATLTLRRR